MEFLIVFLVIALIGLIMNYQDRRYDEELKARREKLSAEAQELEDKLAFHEPNVIEANRLTELKDKLDEYNSRKIDGLYFEGSVVDPNGISVPLKELYSSTLVMGGVGSGKTSSSGMLVSKYLLSQGAGGPYGPARGRSLSSRGGSFGRGAGSAMTTIGAALRKASRLHI